jgi:hypothetical protein
MSRTQRTAQGGPRDARVTEERHLTGQDREDEVEGTDDRGRRWYHLRPEPRRRTDLMGFNSTWWGMAVGWLIVIILVAFPFPWWW